MLPGIAIAQPRKTPTWFALHEDRPLFGFPGIWTTWHGTRGTKAEPVDGEHLLFRFLICDANAVVAPVTQSYARDPEDGGGVRGLAYCASRGSAETAAAVAG